jgi:hypothetical protein
VDIAASQNGRNNTTLRTRQGELISRASFFSRMPNYFQPRPTTDLEAHAWVLSAGKSAVQAFAALRDATSRQPTMKTHIDLLESLLFRSEWNVNAEGPGQTTPLMLACKELWPLSDVQLLLSVGAHPTSPAPNTQNLDFPLILAGECASGATLCIGVAVVGGCGCYSPMC